MKACRVHYEGKVQGVGFRYQAKLLAREFEVNGAVKNLPDGRVELEVAGAPEEVDGFLQSIRGSVLAGHIQHETSEVLVGTPKWKGFQILS